MPRLILTLILFAALAPAQSSTGQKEILVTGRVIEEGSGIAVHGATVEVFDDEQRDYFGPRIGKLAATLTADVNGEFSTPLKPGFYTFYATKPEFSELNVGNYGGPKTRKDSWAAVDIRAQEPVKPVRLYLTPQYSITGSLIDAETGKPLPGLLVFAMEREAAGGEWIAYAKAPPAKSAANGNFEIKGLISRDYVLEVKEPDQDKSKLMASRFTAEEVHEIPTGHRLFYRAEELAFAPAISLHGTVHAGTLEIKKQPRYRALVRLGKEACGDRMVSLVVTRHIDLATSRSFWQVSDTEVPCGSPVLIKDLDPGHYSLVVTDKDRSQQTVRASTEFDIVASNETVALEAKAPATVAVTVKVPESMKVSALEGRKLVFEGLSASFSDFQEATLNAEGKAMLGPVPVGRYRLRANVGLGLTLRRGEYNGTPIDLQSWKLDPNQQRHSLVLEVTDRPWKITGQVLSEDQPVPDALLFLVRLPLDGRSPFYRAELGKAGDDGRFTVSVVEGGEFAVVAVRPQDAERVQEPGVLAGKVPVAKRVKVDGQDVDAGKVGVHLH